MRVSHVPAVVFDDPNLVSCAGLAPVLQLAERAGLQDLAGAHVRIDKPGGGNARVKVPALVAGMIAGADSINEPDSRPVVVVGCDPADDSPPSLGADCRQRCEKRRDTSIAPCRRVYEQVIQLPAEASGGRRRELPVVRQTDDAFRTLGHEPGHRMVLVHLGHTGGSVGPAAPVASGTKVPRR